jgi:hypothetical protein
MGFSAVGTSNWVRFVSALSFSFMNYFTWPPAGAVADSDHVTVLRLLQDLSLQNPRTIAPERLGLMVVSGQS